MLNLRPSTGAHLSTAVTEVDRINDRDHFVQFYHHERTLIQCAARYFAVGFARGNVALAIMRKHHRDAIEAELHTLGHDAETLRESGMYLPLDAKETLDEISVGDNLDPRRFRALLGSWVDAGISNGSGVRAFGQMSMILCEQGNDVGAAEMEGMWNDLGKTHEFAMFCAYPSAHFAQTGKARCLSRMCEAHSRVISG
jgi:hypothetical protein